MDRLPVRATLRPRISEAPGQVMEERLKAEEELEGPDESRGDVPGGEEQRKGKEFSRERRPEEAGLFEALAGEKSGSLHGFREETAQALCHPVRKRKTGSNSLSGLELTRCDRGPRFFLRRGAMAQFPFAQSISESASYTPVGVYSKIVTELRRGALSHLAGLERRAASQRPRYFLR